MDKPVFENKLVKVYKLDINLYRIVIDYPEHPNSFCVSSFCALMQRYPDITGFLGQFDYDKLYDAMLAYR